MSLRQTALQCEHVCIYALVQVSASQRVYVFVHKDTEGGWGGSLFRSDCMEIILLYVFQFHLIEQREEKLFIQHRVETFKLFKGISLF